MQAISQNLPQIRINRTHIACRAGSYTEDAHLPSYAGAKASIDRFTASLRSPYRAARSSLETVSLNQALDSFLLIPNH